MTKKFPLERHVFIMSEIDSIYFIGRQHEKTCVCWGVQKQLVEQFTKHTYKIQT